MNIEQLQTMKPGRDLDRVHPEFAALTPEDIKRVSLEKLEAYIQRGRGNAEKVVRSILEEQPRDRYVRPAAMCFAPYGAEGIDLMIGDDRQSINAHALDQGATHLGMTTRYLHALQEQKAPWANELTAHNLNTLLQHQDAAKRYLVRQVGDRVRGWMTDAYKRIDSRPFLDAVMGAAQNANAEIVDGIYTETRLSLKVIRVQPIEVFTGEWMVFGLDYSNSDYGDGRAELNAFLARLRCLNGAVSVTEFRKVHLGGRYKGEDGWSERTLSLDAAAQASAARDQVRLLLSDDATQNMVDGIRRANATEVSPEKVQSYLKTRVSKAEGEAIVGKFASADIQEVPAGQTAWRLSNAISWLGRESTDGARKMQLERMAGAVVSDLAAA